MDGTDQTTSRHWMDPDAIEKTFAAYGWEADTTEFRKRYLNDVWVYNLTNALVKATQRVYDLEREVSR